MWMRTRVAKLLRAIFLFTKQSNNWKKELYRKQYMTETDQVITTNGDNNR